MHKKYKGRKQTENFRCTVVHPYPVQNLLWITETTDSIEPIYSMIFPVHTYLW